MATKGNVSFNPKGGPVMLEISSGYSTTGSFILSTAKKGEYDFHKFGSGRVDDDIRDFFLIPIPLNELPNYILVVNGKYGPAPGHQQIRIEYTFTQDSKVLSVIPDTSEKIEETTNEFFLRFTNFFDFKIGE